MPQDYQKLLKRVEELEKWKAEKTRQQISYPLDTQSQANLGKYFMNIFERFDYEILGAASHPASLFVGTQGNYSFQLQPQTYFRYTVDTNANTVTVIGSPSPNGSFPGRFPNDTEVIVFTSDTFPAPLAINTSYYVIETSTDQQTFKLTTVQGDTDFIVNFTTRGVGVQLITLVT